MNFHLRARIDSLWKFISLRKHAAIMTVVSLVGCIAAVQLRPAPPLLQLDTARRTISAARHLQAVFFAPREMALAEEAWQQTWDDLHETNKKWFLTRNYSGINKLAMLTSRRAETAALRATSARDSLALNAIAIMLAVKDRMLDVQSAHDEIEMPRAYRGALRQSALMVAECEAAFAREDFIVAAARANAALESVSRVSSETVEMIDDYFASIKKWRRWVKETIHYSDSTGREVIIVDKLAHVCQVYAGGELLAEYPAELGPRWMGQKQRQGDNATPEGRYFIIEKKEDDATRYYKALEINYPNREDSARFAVAQQSGKIPKTAHPGGLIEIHGDGGKGSDWTAGCVALENQHMDELYTLAKVGTPVTIVGSLHGLTGRKMNTLAVLRGGQ